MIILEVKLCFFNNQNVKYNNLTNVYDMQSMDVGFGRII